MWWGSWSKEVKIRDFAHALEDITTSFYTLEAPSRLWKMSWQKPHVTNYGKLGAESSSCKTQLTRQPFLPTRELSGQAQLPSTCSRPHATFWKCLSAYQQAKVTPDNICFISPCKTLNTKWKVSTNCIDTENIALLTERPRTPGHKPRPNHTRLRSSLRHRDSPHHLQTQPCARLQMVAQPRALNAAAFTGCCARADALLCYGISTVGSAPAGSGAGRANAQLFAQLRVSARHETAAEYR